MSFLTPPLPASPPSPWKFNRRNKSAASQDLDRSSGSESDHEAQATAQPSGIDIDPGKKKIFGVSLSIAAPQPALRKIKYKVDKKDGSKDKITAKQLLLNNRLSATVAAIEEEKKKDSIIADLSQQRASEIAQNIQDKRDKEERWKYGGGRRHRTFKKIWAPHPRAKTKHSKSSRSRSKSPKGREPFDGWRSWKAASPSYHDEYRRWRDKDERPHEKNLNRTKMAILLNEVQPVFDLTDNSIRPRSLLAFAQDGQGYPSYPLTTVHFTDAEPLIRWSANPKSEKIFYLSRKKFTAHANRDQLELFAAIADFSAFEHLPDEKPVTERPWYPPLQTLIATPIGLEHTSNVAVESIDEKIAAAKKAKEGTKSVLLKKVEEILPPQPAPFMSSFKPITGSEPIAEESHKSAGPHELATEYEEFLKEVGDKDNEAPYMNNEWDSESDVDEQTETNATVQECEAEEEQQELEEGEAAPSPPMPERETTIEMDVPEETSLTASTAIYATPTFAPGTEENVQVEEAPPMPKIIPVKEFLLDIDTLAKEFQDNISAPEVKQTPENEENEKKGHKKSKKKKGKKLNKRNKKKQESSSSDSDASDSSSESDKDEKKKRKKRKRKSKKHKKNASSSSSSSDSDTDKKKKKKRSKKSHKEQEFEAKLLIDLQLKKQEIVKKLDDLEHISDKKTRKSLAKGLEDEVKRIDKLEKLLLRQSRRKRKKRKDSDSSSSDSDSEATKKKSKKRKKKKAKKESSSSESSDEENKSQKKKRSDNKEKEIAGNDNKDENVVEPERPSRKRPADEDITPIHPKAMFLDFATSVWMDKARLIDAPFSLENKNDAAKSQIEGVPATDGTKNVSSEAKLGEEKKFQEFRAFQAVSVASAKEPPGTTTTIPGNSQELYSPGASESEVSESVASPAIAPSIKIKKFPINFIDRSQIVNSDSQTSTSFFNVASAEESRDVNPLKSLKQTAVDYFPEDDLVPPGMEPCILDKPPRSLKYSYETGDLESSDDKGSDMDMDDDDIGRRVVKSKIKSLKMQSKLKTKPSAIVSPVKFSKDGLNTDKDIPEDSSLSPNHAKKQQKAPMTVETVFYQDSESEEDEMRPPRLDFTALFAESKDETDLPAIRQEKSHRDDNVEKSSKREKKRDKRERSRDRRKSPSPRRHRSPDRRGPRSADKREVKRYSRSPERRRRRSPSPKKRHRSPSPRRRRKDSPRYRRSRTRSRSHSPRNKRSKRRSRSRSPRRTESPKKRSFHASESQRSASPYQADENNPGRIPVIGTTIPPPMPAAIFPGDDKPPNGTSHRLSLDQRIELELGVKLGNTPPPAERQSCYYPQATPYNVAHYPYAPGTVVQVGNMMEVIPSVSPSQRHNSTQQTNIVQVGNVLQVVPLARATAIVAPTPVAPEPPSFEPSQNPLIKAIQAERERRKLEKEARKAEREARRKARQAKRDAKHMTIAEKLKLSNSLIADLIDMKAERNEGLVLGQDMEDEELLLEALDPPSPPGQLEIVVDRNSTSACKSILMTPGYNTSKEISFKKNVKFADGLVPGEESESDSGACEKPAPKPKLPKEKRFKKKLKKKIKVQVVRQTVAEPAEVDEEDDLPPPSPPPGDPPPIMYASFPFGGQVQYPVYQIGSSAKPQPTSK